MPPTRSPEIESVTRRVLLAFETGDMAAMANLVFADPSLRVLGFALDEWWTGPGQFLKIRDTQVDEIPALHIQVEKVEAFEDGAFGWEAISTTVVTSETKTPMRHTAVLRLEAGAWKVILWQNSVPVPNTVNKAARVAAAAESGTIMVSSTTRDLVGSLEGMGEPKIVALKGLSDTHQIVPIEWE